MSEWTINDNEFLRQYEVNIEGHLAKMEYSAQDRKIFLTKLVVPEGIQSENFKDEFIRGVLSTIEEKENLRVVPTSPQIVSFLRRNRRQYKELLPVGIRI